MEAEFRQRARQRYTRRCGYCGVSEAHVGATLTIDHHQPRIHGGGDEDENIIYCCARCNEHKGHYWHDTDPPHIPLLHPLHDDLSVHLLERDDGQVNGITPQGVFFIQRLRLNRPQLIAYRLRRRAEATRRDRLRALDHHVEELRRRIAELHELFEVIDNEIEREGVQQMDRLEEYREIIHHLLEEYERPYQQHRDSGVETAVICDDLHGHFLLMRLGWRGETRVRRALFYLRLKDGKIWIEEDWTQEGVATELIAASVPREDIVLAFTLPELRHLTEFAAV